jgi:bifunctional enzyme CysN/CysC
VAVPISALNGDNVVTRSEHTPWYSGSPVLELLEAVPVDRPSPDASFRMPVQFVLRPDLNFRGFAGQIAAGSVKPGDRVRILPSGKETRVRRIARAPEDGGDAPLAYAPQSVVLTFEDEVDCSRGDVIVCIGRDPAVTQRIECDLVWMQEQPLVRGQQLVLRVGTKQTACTVRRVRWLVDVDTLGTQPADTLRLNEIGRVELECEERVVVDGYRECHGTGALILVDRMTNATAGAGMVRLATEAGSKRAHWETEALATLERAEDKPSFVNAEERERRWQQKPRTILLYGPPGSGKTREAHEMERKFFDQGAAVVMLDGQAMRRGLSKDLGFSDEDRSENLRRAAEVARLLNDQGFVVILAMAAPDPEARERARDLVGVDRWEARDMAARGNG